MGDDVEAGGGGTHGPIYAIEMRERGEGADVAIIRIPGGAAPESRVEDVWRTRFPSLEAARAVMQVMMERPGRWAGWARMAAILGSDFLNGLIEAEVVEAGRAAARAAARRRSPQSHPERSLPAMMTVHVSLVLEGVPRIVASSRGRPFMVLRLGTAAEAWRVWDWVRWQAHSLPQWYELVERKGGDALRRLILESMLAAERSARAGGLAASGPRPLLKWRPAGAVDPDDRNGKGSDDVGEGEGR